MQYHRRCCLSALCPLSLLPSPSPLRCLPPLPAPLLSALSRALSRAPQARTAHTPHGSLRAPQARTPPPAPRHTDEVAGRIWGMVLYGKIGMGIRGSRGLVSWVKNLWSLSIFRATIGSARLNHPRFAFGFRHFLDCIAKSGAWHFLCILFEELAQHIYITLSHFTQHPSYCFVH